MYSQLLLMILKGFVFFLIYCLELDLKIAAYCNLFELTLLCPFKKLDFLIAKVCVVIFQIFKFSYYPQSSY